MPSNLTWEKKIFPNLYRIYENRKQIGQLKDKPFSQTAKAQLNDQQYSFRTKGFFKQRTEIRDNSGNRVLGEINYSQWKTKATISLDNEVIHWKYDNSWNTSWSVYDEKGIKIKYKGSFSNGNIQGSTNDALLLLCGLYITNYYWQTSIAVLIIIFMPIFINN